ncbi:MAG: hypothetical protein C0465_26255 [Ralstonia sp.]|jgi:hypothetical protein|uniref:hypothetical protein n=1 Tax=Ralstonia sp. TaxID=54061 RepID=UPI002579ABDC|nr:hypothetical protein [Ralstonia sp.]MBA4073682.1 hypothetical protein [Cyanobacteria bacterium PR.023]MBA4234078.1 hypothetical protein [Ralstonia sp.]
MSANNTSKPAKTDAATAAAKKATREANLGKVLDLATSTAQGELGDADNRTVSAEATLSVSATEGDTTEKAGVTAAVSLGVTSSTETVAAKK